MIMIMESITKEQEERIDKSKIYFGEIRYERPDKHIIQARNIYLYGEVNVNDKSDIDLIKKFDLVDPDHNWIDSNFNFEEGTCTTIEGIRKGYDTWDPVKWFLYNYCLLGKPERVIIYNYPNYNRYGNR